ncbi:hypothetical protein [Streptomyces sp. NBC_01439]|uniref:hypothetical protein n=1 Tax=Streptomyces sp. NBC_01439 TaxID=2903867 RepID=UPI002E2CDEEF|nr:hypothetical protein [Streptomyces sp. NBC_01439]
MHESYGYPDVHGIHPQPATTMSWHRPEHGETLGMSGETHLPWDPVEELASLLQENPAPGQPESFTRASYDVTGDTTSTIGLVAGLKQSPNERPAKRASSGHRRSSSRTPVATLVQTGSLFTAVLVAIIATLVSVLSGMAICDALRHSAGLHTAREVVSWWPLLIYGPWTVASLSILRSALHQRRAVHSWAIVLLFSTLATLLCVAQAPRTLAAEMSSALPAVAALACFQQLVRQITLTRPPRQAAPRHRNPSTSILGAGQTATARSGPDGVRPGYSVADGRENRSPSNGRRFGYGA